MKFTKSAAYKEPSREEDCYICMTNVKGFNKKKIQNIVYSDIPTVTKPVESSIDIDNEIACSVSSMESMTISEDSERDSDEE